MKTISFYTLGCRANQAETDLMKEDALSSGLKIVSHREISDICVINTCTVTKLADKKSRQAIKQAARPKRSEVIVTGCLVESQKKEIEAIKGVDLTINNKEKTDFLNILSKIIPQSISDKNLISNSNFSSFTNRIRANLIIQTGCENFCSYCIVPHVRGKEVNRSFEEILNRASKMVKNGIREIVLTGINTGSFNNLPYLIEKLSENNQLLRIRTSSIEPIYIIDELINTVAKNNKVCRHLHIPLQSGDDVILKKMNRKYTTERFKDMIKKIREKIPDIAITTDIIVGFPGESNEQFYNSINFVKEISFTRIHVFRYSKRKNTPAEKFGNQIDPRIISKRAGLMKKTRSEFMLSFHKSLINKIEPVLIEQRDKKTGLLEGLTSNYVRAFAEGENCLIGSIVPIKILKASVESVRGVIAGIH